MPFVQALKRKHKKLQEEYTLKTERLKRIREAYVIETDPSHKFKLEKQIEQLKKECEQFEQELQNLEHQLEVTLNPVLSGVEGGVEGQPFEWNYDTLPLDLSSKIEFLTQYFVGRQEVVERIEQFLQEHKSGYLAIVGEAGIGKSALLAQEIKKRGAVHHFVDDKQNSAKDEVFLRCIVQQLRQKYGFKFEERPPIAVSEWNIYFQKWMKEISTEEKLLICVDALDEAKHYGGSDNLLKYLPHDLPENVYIILTSRPEFKKEDITFLDSTVFERCDLPPLPQTDIETYLTVCSERFSVPNVAEATTTSQEIAAILYQKSEGNPLYLSYLLQECDDENLMLEQADQLPQGLTKFYKKQWKERIWIGDNATKEGRKQILSLLLILKEPPGEEMLLELTDFDRAELQEYLLPLGHFMRTDEPYEVFHDSFKTFISNQFRETIPAYHEQLIEKLWNWQELDRSIVDYAIFWLPIHLFEAKQYDKLFTLSQDGEFQQAQTQIFPDDPGLPLHTLRVALQAAADIDDAQKMAEFLLAHARHIFDFIRRDNPIRALKQGELQYAWRLADSYDRRTCIQWYLLLAWTLKTMNRLPEALATLRLLQTKNLLLGNENWGHPGEAYLLAQVYTIDPEIFADLYQRLDGNSPQVYIQFLSQGETTVATKILHDIHNGRLTLDYVVWEFTDAQLRLKEQKQAQQLFRAAMETAQCINNDWRRGEALRIIAKTQVYTGNITGLLETVQRIRTKWGRALILGEVAALYRDQNTAYAFLKEAFEAAREDEMLPVEALGNIIEAQARAGDYPGAIESVDAIKHEASQAQLLLVIVTAQAYAGDFKQAFETTQRIPLDEPKILALVTIAHAQAQSGDISAALETAHNINDKLGRATALEYIAEIQTQTEDIRADIKSVGMDKRKLMMLAEQQAQNDQNEQAQELFRKALSLGGYSEREWEQKSALMEIAIAQALTGNIVAALDTVQSMEDKIREDSALQAIVRRLAQKGKFSIALEIGQQIGDRRIQAEALRSIVTIQVQTGELLAAFDTAQSIEDIGNRSKAFRIIAEEQIRKGEYTAAFDTVKRIESEPDLRKIAELYAQDGEIATAINIAQLIKDDWEQATVLCMISEAGGHPDDFVVAFDMAKHMKYDQAQAVTLETIAEVQARVGDYTSAFETAQQINYQYIQSESRGWQIIAVAQARRGEISEAFDTLQRITDDRDHSSALLAIAEVQVKNGDLSEAFDTTQSIKRDWAQAEALMAIVEAHVHAGDFQSAFDMAQYLNDYLDDPLVYMKKATPTQSGALQSIAEAQMRAGDLSAAVNTTQYIQHGVTRVWTLVSLAKNQAELGKREKARELFEIALAMTPEKDYWKENRLERIAILQVQLGLSEDAIHTAELIIRNRNRYLPQIATALVEKGDKEHLKRWLFPCAYYLDAAYAMCGKLARLYPEQAKVIANVICPPERA